MKKQISIFTSFLMLIFLSSCGSLLSKQKVKQFDKELLTNNNQVLTSIINTFFLEKIDTVTFISYKKSEIFLMFGYQRDSIARFKTQTEFKTSQLIHKNSYDSLFSFMKKFDFKTVNIYKSNMYFSYRDKTRNACFDLVYEPGYNKKFNINLKVDANKFIVLDKEWIYPIDTVWYFKESKCWAI
jgi:hypothetical protein